MQKQRLTLLQELLAIIVGEAGLPPPIPVYNTEALKPGAEALSTPIIPGQQEISVTVSIVYLIG